MKKLTSILALISFVLIAGLAIPQYVQAQNGGFAGAYSRMGLGPRGMAMGNAMTSTTTEGIYAKYNPALAASVGEDIQLDFSSALLPFDRQLNSISGAFSLSSPTDTAQSKAGLNITLLNARVTDIDGRTVSGYPTSKLSTNEMQLLTSFGIQMGPRLQSGVGIKINYANFHEDVSSAVSLGVDIGMLYNILPNWSVGFTIQDLLSSYNWNTDQLYGMQNSQNNNDNFPTRFKFGTTYQVDQQLAFSAEYEIRRQSSDVESVSVSSGIGAPTPVTNTEELITSSSQLRFGGRYAIHERLTLRTGWSFEDLDNRSYSGRFSAGFSVHLPLDAFQPSIDYAFIREAGNFSNMHVFAIRIML